MRRGQHVAHTGKRRNTYKDFVDKPEGNRLLERPWCGWEDIKLNLK